MSALERASRNWERLYRMLCMLHNVGYWTSFCMYDIPTAFMTSSSSRNNSDADIRPLYGFPTASYEYERQVRDLLRCSAMALAHWEFLVEGLLNRHGLSAYRPSDGTTSFCHRYQVLREDLRAAGREQQVCRLLDRRATVKRVFTSSTDAERKGQELMLDMIKNKWNK